MERTAWPDERLDDAFREMREEIRVFREEAGAEFREIRRELATLKLFMLGQLVTVLAAVIAVHG